jgi:hypothetical protein
MNARPGASAIDGTVIQAAASAYGTMKAEAARSYADGLKAEAAAKPEDTVLARKAELAAEAATVAVLRGGAREEKGRDSATVEVAPTEPDAVVQPQKQAGFAPSYKPTIIAHESGLITGQRLDNMSETKFVGELLDQQQAIMGAPPTVFTGDAGFSNLAIISECVSRGINLLAPSGNEGAPDMQKSSANGKFLKQRFTFNVLDNLYVCPAGKQLIAAEQSTDEGRPYTRYRANPADCAACALRPQCTTADARTVQRYDFIDEAKEALAAILRHPAARADYSRRKVIVEPRFAALRYRQGLVRFRRRGLPGVALEWALHCLAHNFGVAAKALCALLRVLFSLLPLVPLEA